MIKSWTPAPTMIKFWTPNDQILYPFPRVSSVQWWGWTTLSLFPYLNLTKFSRRRLDLDHIVYQNDLGTWQYRELLWLPVFNCYIISQYRRVYLFNIYFRKAFCDTVYCKSLEGESCHLDHAFLLKTDSYDPNQVSFSSGKVLKHKRSLNGKIWYVWIDEYMRLV